MANNEKTEISPKKPSMAKGPMGHGPMGMGVGQKPKNFKKSAKNLLLSLKGHYFVIILALAFAVASTTFNIVAPNIIKNMGEVILIGGTRIDMGKIAYYGIILICLYVSSSILNYVQGIIMAKISAKITQKYRSDIIAKVNKLPLKYFDSNSYGDTLSRITNDVDTLGQSLSDSLSSTISSVTMLVGAIIMMLVNSPLLTLVMVAMMPISIGLILRKNCYNIRFR